MQTLRRLLGGFGSDWQSRYDRYMIATGSLLLYPALPPRGEFSLSGRDWGTRDRML